MCEGVYACGGETGGKTSWAVATHGVPLSPLTILKTHTHTHTHTHISASPSPYNKYFDGDGKTAGRLSLSLSLSLSPYLCLSRPLVGLNRAQPELEEKPTLTTPIFTTPTLTLNTLTITTPTLTTPALTRGTKVFCFFS